MNDMRAELRGSFPSLTAAIRRARVEEAERTDVVDDLRCAEAARLEALFEALQPVLAQLPEDVDLFDTGIVPGQKPRLFIDMIAFIDMGRDRRTYRFIQDARHGRVIIAESERIDTMVNAVTDYIARRLVERDKAMASAQIASATAPSASAIPVDIAAAFQQAVAPQTQAAVQNQPPRLSPRLQRNFRRRGWFANAFRFVLEFLGSIALVGLLWAAAYGLWVSYLRALWVGHFGAPPV